MSAEQMMAGRELDAEIFCRVFGRERGPDGWFRHPGAPGWPTNPDDVPPYSTDLAAAWEIIQHFGSVVQLVRYPDAIWRCTLWNPRLRCWRREAQANTMPLAVCRAALAAVEDP